MVIGRRHRINEEFIKNGKVISGNPKLLVDIGTNGEMALATNDRLWCCSTAAGPAFEGAGIHNGMPARTGAIYQAKLDNNNITCMVLGDTQATGICGSGLLDAVSVMCETGVFDEKHIIILFNRQNIFIKISARFL
ncbi:MAG: ASKHA domain-containing protein [Oscillospiraceae bacterium]|nr:ASKHA domain-containing protein [Oscillospiraceae bacterium]MDD4414307.1 ASKHA domain-containing protein [Oscillospiraceae bacterium]